MRVNEVKLALVEDDIPRLAPQATKRARAQALSSGSKVLEVVNGRLVEQRPDGSRLVLRRVEQRRVVKKGSKISLVP